ncbi:MAG: hypothetical protein M0Z84_06380 [Gammaproteobacteria bacterium]|nr:hypothetical protein [Gammaproteobacteria bacterium]
MAKVADNLVSAQSVLISGAAGVATMAIADTLWMAYRLPPRWTALAISFLLGVVTFFAVRQTLAQRILYYLCSSSIIFLVAVGSNRAGMILAELTQSTGPPPSISRPDLNTSSQKRVLQHLDMGARTRTSGYGRRRPRLMGGNRKVAAPSLTQASSAAVHILPSPRSARKPHFFTRW